MTADIFIPVKSYVLGPDNETEIAVQIHYAFALDPLGSDMAHPDVVHCADETYVAVEYDCPIIGDGVVWRKLDEVRVWSAAVAVYMELEEAKVQASMYFAEFSGYL